MTYLILNIGLHDDDANMVIRREEVYRAVRVSGAQGPFLYTVHQSDSEPTMVVGGEFTPEQVYAIAEQLNQKAIACYDPATGTGMLIGPRKAEWIAAWGDFNPKYFIMPTGERLSAVYDRAADEIAASKED